mmetsp:Transcript_150189/g.418449  ORF Transcript_150189/g.418449 Transcript_150189/m.418449 type:complete len:407 (+) Transcript_150189:205-1425(+)
MPNSRGGACPAPPCTSCRNHCASQAASARAGTRAASLLLHDARVRDPSEPLAQALPHAPLLRSRYLRDGDPREGVEARPAGALQGAPNGRPKVAVLPGVQVPGLGVALRGRLQGVEHHVHGGRAGEPVEVHWCDQRDAKQLPVDDVQEARDAPSRECVRWPDVKPLTQGFNLLCILRNALEALVSQVGEIRVHQMRRLLPRGCLDELVEGPKRQHAHRLLGLTIGLCGAVAVGVVHAAHGAPERAHDQFHGVLGGRVDGHVLRELHSEEDVSRRRSLLEAKVGPHFPAPLLAGKVLRVGLSPGHARHRGRVEEQVAPGAELVLEGVRRQRIAVLQALCAVQRYFHVRIGRDLQLRVVFLGGEGWPVCCKTLDHVACKRPDEEPGELPYRKCKHDNRSCWQLKHRAQ